MIGAHPLKVGLGPMICELLRSGIVSAMAMNGAAIIHDFELAMAGRTSEDVGAGLEDGSFGMAEETGVFLNRAATLAGRKVVAWVKWSGVKSWRRAPSIASSVFLRRRMKQATRYRSRHPRADIIHMHPTADGAAIGKATLADFHRLAAVIVTLSGGVAVNLGSAVVMPEVFLKALNLCRNLGNPVGTFTTADMDFIRQYRPRVNVVERPTQRRRTRYHAHLSSRNHVPAAGRGGEGKNCAGAPDDAVHARIAPA